MKNVITGSNGNRLQSEATQVAAKRLPEQERILGIAYEEAFWRSLFRVRSARKGLYEWSRYGKEIQLDNFDIITFWDEWESRHEARPVILDVGSGASFCTGNLLHGKEIDIHYIDPLAFYYNRIISKTRPQHFPLVEFGTIEQLSAFYPHGNIAFIHVQNALDHCQSPLRGIIECLRSLAIGGILYLKHFPNEAERENYRGFHQYNIEFTDHSLVIWNRQERHDINALLKSFTDISVSLSNIGEVIAVIRKTNEVPPTLYNDAQNLRALCEMQSQTVAAFSSFNFSMKYHIRRRFYIIVQNIMRRFSPQFKAKLKKYLFHKQ